MKKTFTIAKAEDWLTIPKVNEVYEKMMGILDESMGVKDVNEYYFEQNLDNKRFRAKIKAKKDLDSRTTLILDIIIFTRDTPKETEEGLYGTVDLKANAILEVSYPSEEKVPKIFRRPLTLIWWYLSYQRQYRYWEEYSEDFLKTYITEMRDFFGLEPSVGKIKRMYYRPII